ncbi:helix-turn-helix domain-containing protein [Lentibacillus sediminis]|uniref:helix-turn-helix domain-containing protein n=1 Tax=Lentibacillus sediminis TaxID=1940529 RepID=UPI000C1BCE1B|nr:helix-turn-helix domain-containing protein [Lentibacillus sediminis]
MSSNYDNINTQLENQEANEKTKRYVELVLHSIELEKKRAAAYSELGDGEEGEANRILKEMTTPYLPEFLLVSEVSALLGVSHQMVRRYCTEGKIKAKQRLEGSGKWLIPTEQFLATPEFIKYIQEKEVQRINSIKVAETMLEMLEEDTEEDRK